MKPVASILIPNFNNGRTSSLRGDRDFLGDLLRSLDETLGGSEIPAEVLIADDGSTDDSLETARRWVACGEGFRGDRRLIELPRSGVLSAVLNRLMNEARGDYLLRLDGDIVIHTPRWVDLVLDEFGQLDPDFGVLGTLQLVPSGMVHSAGDYLIHPRGYHHIGQGARPEEIPTGFEIDHAMGCFYAMRREVFDSVGLYDESILRGQTEDYGVRVLLGGWRAWFSPRVQFTHYHSQRGWRDNVADSPEALEEALNRFKNKWGFDRLCPDLDLIHRRYAGTNLLWRKTRQGAPQSRWARFESDPVLQQQCAEVVQTIDSLGHRRVVELNAGDGLLAHLLAQRGLDVLAVERSIDAVREACRFIGCAAYPRRRPEVVQAPDERNWARLAPAADVVLVSQLERHPNPIAAIEAAASIITPTGLVIFTAEERPTPFDDSSGRHAFRAHELNALISNSRMLELQRPTEAGRSSRMLMALAARSGRVGMLHHFNGAVRVQRAAG